MEKILIAAPHPDDETLGCGGTILKYKALGNQVYWLILTNISQQDKYRKKVINSRQNEIAAAARAYNFDEFFKLDFPATRLDTLPKRQIIEQVTDVIGKIKPEVVYIPNRSDVHSDHRVTFDVMVSATKTFRYPFIKKILMYEVVSETEFAPSVLDNAFIPNSFSDITNYLDKKLAIMKIYKHELRRSPFPRSKENIKALATFRGATATVKYAEAFTVLKEIW
ncbi:MAG: PIG-L family deacetylase [Candidatus Brocadia sp.]|nr:PIG-L family deacetylase [Candidatus Brocadia sp.]